jgi:hypothetical protein
MAVVVGGVAETADATAGNLLPTVSKKGTTYSVVPFFAPSAVSYLMADRVLHRESRFPVSITDPKFGILGPLRLSIDSPSNVYLKCVMRSS